MAKNEKELAEFNDKLKEKGVWKRIVALEKAIFKGKENPKETDETIIQVLEEKITKLENKIKKILLFESRIEKLEEKIKELQSVEQNLEDTKQKMEEVTKEKETLESTISSLNEEIRNLKERNRRLDSENSKEKENITELNRQNASLEAIISEKESSIKNMETERNRYQRFFEEKNQENEGLKLSLQESRIKNTNLLKENERYKEDAEEAKKKFENLEKHDAEKFAEATVKLNALKEKYDEQRNINAELQIKINTTEQELNKKIESIKILNEEISNHKTAIIKLKTEKQSLQEDIESANQELKTEKSLVQQQREKIREWENETEVYQKILKAVLQCDSLCDMLKFYDIKRENGNKDTANIIHFIELFGNQDNFLAELYSSMEMYKKEHKTFLTKEELDLIAQLNQYYAESVGEDAYDVLQYPQNGDSFDKTTMKDIDNRSKVYRNVEGVYVPAIMRDAENYFQLALIKGVS